MLSSDGNQLNQKLFKLIFLDKQNKERRQGMT